MNRKKSVFKPVVFIAAGLFLIIVINSLYIKNETLQYKIGHKSVNNPDRGFYVQVKSDHKEKIEKYQDNVRIVLVTLDLYEYRNAKIPDEKLQELEKFLEEAKEHHIKCIFRAAYGFHREESNDADSLERIEEHIQQIAMVLNSNKDQIICVQAGFFGPWGEWHSSKYLEKEETARQNRCWLLQELLEQLDGEIVIDVRRPRFIREAVDAGLPLERIGYHNDGLLGSESDLGTYDDKEYSRAEEMQWLKENLLTGFNGGEMPGVNEYSQAERALEEFPKMKLTYLNLKYNEEVYELWNNQTVNGKNAFDYIVDHLGYRFYISEVKYPVKLKGGILGWNRKIEITLNNEGFAPIGKNYSLEWVVEDINGQKHIFEESSSLSQLESNESIRIELPIKQIKDIPMHRIGIRISSVDDKEKESDNCVELVNDEFCYEQGINYFLQVNPEAVIDGL